MKNSVLKSWKNSLNQSKEVLEIALNDSILLESCAQFTHLLVQLYQTGGKLLLCGNGGSHCDANHFAEELTGRYRKNRPPFGAMALGEASHLTCVGNDFGFDHVFERQVRALARTEDLIVFISTSGQSQNQILACKAAREMNVKTVGLLGKGGGHLKALVDHAMIVPGETSDRIQEMHIKVIHSAVESFERVCFPELYES